MELDIILTVTSIAVAAITSVVGIWIERDPSRTKTIAYILSSLIVMASFVSIAQSYMDERAKQKMEGDLARMLVMLNQMADKAGGESSELQALIKSELNTQSRNNPSVIKRVAQRISDNGGDPSRTLGAYLPPADVESLSRRGALKVKRRVSKRLVVKPKRETRTTTQSAPSPTPKTIRLTPSETKRSSQRATSSGSKSATRSKPLSLKKRASKAKTQTRARAEGQVRQVKTKAKAKAKRQVNQAKSKAKSRAKKAKDDAKKRANRAKNKAKKRAKDKAKNAIKSFGF